MLMPNYQPEMPFAPDPLPQSPLQQPPPKRGSWLVGLLFAGLGILTLGGVLCVAGIWYVATNVDRWLVGLGREAIVAMIEESEIPAAEKTEVITQVDRVVTAYKERRIDQADLERALSELEDAPALRVLSLYGLDEIYLNDSGLNESEIAAGRRLFARGLRGVYEGKLTDEALYDLLPGEENESVDASEQAGAQNIGEQLTLVANSAAQSPSADNLRESLVKLKVLVDNAQIPDEPFQLDIGDEVKKLVDQLLAGKEPR
jgi:hypothetical protein